MRRGGLSGRIRSFGYALQGIQYAARGRNFRLQVLLGLLAAAAGWLLRISASDWLLLILTSLAVLTMETINTAIEAVVDLASPQIHPLAKVAKDTSAGAVLLVSLAAVVVGIWIFLPRLLALPAISR